MSVLNQMHTVSYIGLTVHPQFMQHLEETKGNPSKIQQASHECQEVKLNIERKKNWDS